MEKWNDRGEHNNLENYYMNVKEYSSRRKLAIQQAYQNGEPAAVLAKKYHLSMGGVYKLCKDIKRPSKVEKALAYLKEYPRATPQKLKQKCGLSYEYALRILRAYKADREAGERNANKGGIDG